MHSLFSKGMLCALAIMPMARYRPARPRLILYWKHSFSALVLVLLAALVFLAGPPPVLITTIISSRNKPAPGKM